MSKTLRRVLVGVPIALFLLVLLGAIAAHDNEKKGPDAQALPGEPLRKLGAARGLLVGTAVDDAALRNEAGYRKDLVEQFGALTPENAMKWDALEPERGKLRWGAADRAVDFARKHDMRVRGHTLVWHAQLPGWIVDGKLPADELRPLMKAHITKVMRRYKGRVRTWDVVNEVVGDDGKLRPSVWLDTLGPVFIAEAFAAARKADPDARLAINEIGGESLGPKSDTLLRLVQELKRRGLVDEVGFQAHFNLKGVPPTMAANLKRFADLGVDIAITEADVSLRDGAGPAQLREQAEVYTKIVRTCRSVPRCRAITFWGFTDRHSWIPTSSPGFGTATLLDDELGPKPAFAAVQEALRAG